MSDPKTLHTLLVTPGPVVNGRRYVSLEDATAAGVKEFENATYALRRSLKTLVTVNQDWVDRGREPLNDKERRASLAGYVQGSCVAGCYLADFDDPLYELQYAHISEQQINSGLYRTREWSGLDEAGLMSPRLRAKLTSIALAAVAEQVKLLSELGEPRPQLEDGEDEDGGTDD